MSSQPNEPEWEFAEHTHFLFDPHRYKCGKGGRGGVKSWSFARALLIQAYENPLRVLCAREVQRSIKESVHQLLSDQVTLLELQGFYEVLQNEIRGKNGSKFAFTGLSNLTAATIKSFEGYDRAWVEEAANVTRRSWDILIPTIRKEDSEIWVTWNEELDTDDTHVRFVENTPDDCIVVDMSFDTNPWFPDVLEKERQEFLRQVKSGARKQEDYDNIWRGKCKASVEGAIYPDEIQAALKAGRLCPVPYDPTLKVHTIWDLGWNDAMAIGVVQTAASSVRFIDYIEDSHRTYESYVNELKGKPYAKQLKTAWLPHDGKARNPQTGKSPIELLNKLGLKTDANGVPDIGVKPGIEAARQMFPRVYFDKVNCTPLFNRLRRYARVISLATEEPGAPKHDENAHGADMFRYAAVTEKTLTNDSTDRKPIKYSNQGIV
jgi:phage terminase large subunit